MRSARAMAGVTVVRDGDFLGVRRADRTRARPAPPRPIQATWNVPPGQPSSDTIYDYLKKTGERTANPPAIEAPRIPARRSRERSTRRYRIPYIAHTPLEPRAAVAEWEDGKVTVWTGTQRPFGVRDRAGRGVPHSREPRARDRARHGVRVRRQAHRRGRDRSGAPREGRESPVKLVWTREEEFTWAYFRPAGVIDIKSGVDANGRIVAWAFDNWNSGNSGIQTPYDIALKSTVFHASKSPLRQGSYRALAATANHYAREMHMDEMARALGVDAVEFRMQAPEGRPHARVLDGRRAEDRLAEAVRRRARARHRLRHREGGLRRDGGGSVARPPKGSRSSASSSRSSAARS